MKIRTYTEMVRLKTFEERFRYLSLKGSVGDTTFGYDRYMNQAFYTSKQWRDIRHVVIARDYGLDLAMDGHEIHDRVIIHHMNPMMVKDIIHGNADILNPEFLITTRHTTHNAIHYGDEGLLPKEYTPRRAGDTKFW